LAQIQGLGGHIGALDVISRWMTNMEPLKAGNYKCLQLFRWMIRIGFLKSRYAGRFDWFWTKIPLKIFEKFQHCLVIP